MREKTLLVRMRLSDTIAPTHMTLSISPDALGIFIR